MGKIRNDMTFPMFTSDDFLKLRSIGNLNHYKRRETIVFPETSSRFVYMICKGKVKVYRLSRSGKETILRLLQPYEIFGEYSLLENGRIRESVEALEDCELLLVSKAEFNNFIEENKVFAGKFNNMLLMRNLELENHLADMVFNDVEVRAMRMLISLAEKYGRQTKSGIIIDISVTQYELGNIIGATRETTSTVLNRLKQEGLINIYHRKLVITNLNAVLDRLRKEDGTIDKKKKT